MIDIFMNTMAYRKAHHSLISGSLVEEGRIRIGSHLKMLPANPGIDRELLGTEFRNPGATNLQL